MARKKSKTLQRSSIMEEYPMESEMNDSQEGLIEMEEASCWDQILLNRAFRAGMGILFLGIMLPILVYIFMSIAQFSVTGRSCAIYEEYRVECMAGKSPTVKQCIKAGCCWNSTTEPHCYHSLPSYNNYLKDSASSDGTNISLVPLVEKSPFGTKMHSIRLKIYPKSVNHLSLLFYDPRRYEWEMPPASHLPISKTAFEVKTYGLPEGKPPFSINISDRNSSTFLIGTAEGPLIASDWYWAISLKLPTADVYGWGGAGIGDIVPPTLKLPPGPLPLWAGEGRRPAHPFLIFLDNEGRAHGIYINASGPLEATLLSSGLLTIRAVIKVSMEIHVLAGPTPHDVSRQLAEAIGYPSLPPYWALGLHTCRDDSTNAVDFFTRAETVGLPFDSDCLGLQALSSKAFEVDNGLLSDTAPARLMLTQSGRRYLPVQRPQIEKSSLNAYTDGMAKNLFVMAGNGFDEPFVGTFNNEAVVFPSLLNPSTKDWLTNIFSNFGFNVSATIPGFIMEDDSPLSFGTYGNNQYPTDDLSFVPRGLNNSISQGTLWFLAQHSDKVLHYEIHNSYGSRFCQLLNESLIDQSWPPGAPHTRRLILGEWTYPGMGVYGGHGGSSRVNRTWTAMRSAFMTALSNGLVGIPLSAGIAACGRPSEEAGDGSKTTQPFDSSLCRRWIRLGSLLPLWRVHLPKGDIAKGMMASILDSAKLRYSLIPYIYTQMYKASISGVPVARHLLFDYPESQLTRDADDQLLLGPALMVTPSFIPDAPTVSIVMPNGTWYRYPGGEIVDYVGGMITCMLRRDETPVFVRGGHIIPMQKPGLTAPASRRNPLSLLVALDCQPIGRSTCAQGELFVDDGESLRTVEEGAYDILQFEASSDRHVIVRRLNSWLPCGGQGDISTALDSITVFGATGKVLNGIVSVNGNISVHGSARYVDDDNRVISVTGIGADWCRPVGDDLIINWV
ncbi:lysosomal alpha-glucosidase-like [Ischnura elegans]|uniref:lysosomal alpha-glucosidase-like n=1 Tax=Ischnura elegans TaxID=197161 RepID=UPI001ED8947B|nr:lysosomal alpha-glucosidase-like [Ischnura elegans]XP_046400616.1 lysosomal alpha-glucosidase-like [Ischnura elegans]XP_046400617.1 lysosomal alpha-glucosidase-like [Ischnura elegans]XP_046400618.1 lysosomal alpha-glucosidase-like [Ischnura elegans]XP_046400619.1 lysosomal alpha-glucosidase-like [Ischnura elegans]